jgi:DNA modification methylase
MAKVPGQKPLKLIERLISVHTAEGDSVLDPFCGYGTTGLAAEQLKRNYVLIEKNAEIRNLASQRIENYKTQGIYK